MTKDHARKGRARRTARRTGSSYTSANADTLHVHPAPTLIPVSGTPFGVPGTADMSAAAAAIAAGQADCEWCLASAMAMMMLGDSLVLAVLAASLPLVPNEGFSPVTHVLWSEVQPHANHPYTYVFVDRLTAAHRQNLLDDLVDIWTRVVPHLGGGGRTLTGPDLTSLIIDLTPAPPSVYQAAQTGFVPTPQGPFPALTLTSPDMSGSIEELAERYGFPLYVWGTLPNVSTWVLQQHPKTRHPWGVRQASRVGRYLTLGAPKHPADATSEWLEAAEQAGSVMVLGLWGGGFGSLVHAVQAQEIVAVRSPLQRHD
ncbi:hypothetical protein [Streptomyces sp. NPDC093568]|uniref:hypothetical protein n=1 Tax=Streptomyces sp. NPDC093568 TaxID=3366041 RepID=UPI003812EC7B